MLNNKLHTMGAGQNVNIAYTPVTNEKYYLHFYRTIV